MGWGDGRRGGRGARGAFRLMTLVLAMAAISPAVWAKDSVPDWVKTAAAQSLPSYPAKTPAVVLLDETTYTVATDGRAVERVRRVVKILRPQGRREGTIHVWFDGDTKILSMNVWSIGPDGHEYQMKNNEFTDMTPDQAGIAFADDRFRVAKAPGADPGGVIAYEYEQRRRPMTTEKTWFFQEEIPHLSQSFTLELPQGFTYTTTWANHDAVKEADLEKGRLRWEMNNISAIDLENTPMSPAPDALAGRMTVHYAGPGLPSADVGTWKGVGEWISGISQDRLQASPEITAKAQALTAGKTDFYDKAEAVGEFVQTQVRYFAVEVGIGGYQPHAAKDIFHNLYGDCKDKATLTSAMLSAVGIHSALMMVDSHRGVVDPKAPSLVGNHMIAAIEIPKGYDSPKLHSVVITATGKRYLIFDPTWEKTPFGQLEHGLQGGYGLLIEGAATEVLQLPVLDPSLDTIRRTATFKLDADGHLSGAVTERRFGDVSEMRRKVYSTADAKQQQEFLDHLLQRDFTTFKAGDVKVDNVAALNKEFTMSYSVDADKYARSMGPLLMVRPRVLGDLAPDTDKKVRSVPIDLGETMQATDDFTIELPDGYTVDEVPDPVKLDLGFAAYQSTAEVKGHTLHYTRTYTVRQVLLPADRYADVQKLSHLIGLDEGSNAVFKKQ